MLILSGQKTNCGRIAVRNILRSLNKSFIFCVSSAGNESAGYNPATGNFQFANSASIDYRTLSEEVFHAYQDSYYSGGIGQYNTSSSNPTGQGFSNIEFEHMLWRDITTVPTSFSTENENLYFYFLGKFKEYWPNYNRPIDPNLKPNAMLNAFASALNCISQ